MKRKKYVVVDCQGLPCPRCGSLSETRKHTEITEKIRTQPFYFTLWFHCFNQNCQTTTFMSEDYKVMNKNAAAKMFLQSKMDREELEGQLSFFRNL